MMDNTDPQTAWTTPVLDTFAGLDDVLNAGAQPPDDGAFAPSAPAS